MVLFKALRNPQHNHLQITDGTNEQESQVKPWLWLRTDQRQVLNCDRYQTVTGKQIKSHSVSEVCLWGLTQTESCDQKL